jgi:quercetin dioxygenase-like cupin family protein
MSSRVPASVFVAFGLGLAAGVAARPSLALARGEKVVLENEKVRVVEFALEPGAPMGMHDHPRDRVEITVSGGKVRVTTPDGKTQEAEEKEGSVVFSKASKARHDVVNIGGTTLRAYHVELKP